MRGELFTAPRNPRRVVGVGLIALDVLERDGVVRSADRVGGTCANVLTILSYFGWSSYPIGRLNGDLAAKHVRKDFARFDVKLDYASTGRQSKTPIVRHLLRADGVHRFSLRCPRCGGWLPTYRPVIAAAAEDMLADTVTVPHVVFLDRVSASALRVAAEGRRHGAVVVFEPSAKASSSEMSEALGLADVVKYSRDQKSALQLGTVDVPLEIETLGGAGLRFRVHRPDRIGKWKSLVSVAIGQIRDAAGSGDWCTAGFIHALLGHRRLSAAADSIGDEQAVTAALEFGQTIAAWNCLYEGARGGMYHTPRRSLRTSVRAALAQRPLSRLKAATARDSSTLDQPAQSMFKSFCPGCKST